MEGVKFWHVLKSLNSKEEHQINNSPYNASNLCWRVHLKEFNMMKLPDMVKAIWNTNELGYNISKKFQFISKLETTCIIMCTIATNVE
jgi:hypothetical protein